MRFARPLVVIAATLVLAAPASGTTRGLPPAPEQLHAFLLRADEPLTHTFARTPSFAWLPVSGAERYEFELANSPTFNEGTIVWSDATLKTPAASIPYSLPWMTGSPYALYAHVRAWTADGAGEWSQPFGLNMRWTSVPQPVPTYPGLLGWSTVPGATSYDVWLIEPDKVISTRTNVADEREYYTFHQQGAWSGLVHWRVRAVRNLYGAAQGLPNGLPAVTYGPWSKTYTSANPPITSGPIKLGAAFSDVTSSAAQPEAHRLTPGFAFTGNQALDGTGYELFRAYVFTDRDCVNVVFRGSIVGSPAFAPRTTGPIKMPVSDTEVAAARDHFLADGDEPLSFMADTATVVPTEMDKPSAGPATDTQTPAKPDSGSSDSGSSGSSDSGSGSGSSGSQAPSGDPSQVPNPNLSLPSTPKVTGAPVDLWDSGWPNGRYYWTVVPVEEVAKPQLTTTLAGPASAGATTITVVTPTGFPVGSTITIGSGSTKETLSVVDVNGSVLTLSRGLSFAHPIADVVVNPSPGIEYHDAELPQDVCAAGRVATFGKVSEPVLAGSSSPYASGLSPAGRLIAAFTGRPVFYGTPLVAWQPAVGADEYQIQWSKAKYPWNPVGQRYTFGTSAVLDQVVSGKRVGLDPGTWYYRVRGLDFSLPGTARAMSWSDPVGFDVSRPTFKVVGNATLPKTQTKGATKVSNPTDPFSLTLPAGWKQIAESGTAYKDAPGSPVGKYRATNDVAVASVLVGAGRGTLSLAAWAQKFVDAAKASSAVSNVAASAVSTPAGPAEKITYTYAAGGTSLSYLIYLYASATSETMLSLYAPTSSVASQQADFAKIAASFRLRS